jgi:hypothetical protein
MIFKLKYPQPTFRPNREGARHVLRCKTLAFASLRSPKGTLTFYVFTNRLFRNILYEKKERELMLKRTYLDR